MGQRDSNPAQQEQMGNILLWKHLWILGALLMLVWVGLFFCCFFFPNLNILCNRINKNKPQSQVCLQRNWAAGRASVRHGSKSPLSLWGRASWCCWVCATCWGTTPERPQTMTVRHHWSHGPASAPSSPAKKCPASGTLPLLLLGHSSAALRCLVWQGHPWAPAEGNPASPPVYTRRWRYNGKSYPLSYFIPDQMTLNQWAMPDASECTQACT